MRITRRESLVATVAAGLAGVHTFNASGFAEESSPNERLNLAFVGVGGRGTANLSGLREQNFVAFVDVDEKRAEESFKKFPDVRRFTDFRRMYDDVGSKLDGVVISTPDHTHFHPAYAAMQLGLNVYLEKPLAHNLWETRTLTDFAREQGLATQLGAQRHAMPNMHRVVELIQTQAIGEVSDVYCWIGGDRGMPPIPTQSFPVPATLDYDLWIGPAEFRPYDPTLCPYGWRFWWDYGTGETGNWGCHILDIPFWALGLQRPERVDASGPEVDPERSPKSMQVTYQFPTSQDHGPVKLHWHHGIPEVLAERQLTAGKNNTLFIGDQGMLLCGFDSYSLLPAEQFTDFSPPDPFVPDSPGFHREWINACKGGESATCNFDYAGPLAETVLLGNVAYRGGSFDWNADKLSTGSNTMAQELIREAYRAGWEV